MVIHEIANDIQREDEEKLVRSLASLFAMALADVHGHKCGFCGHEWEHARPLNVTGRQYREAHMCPSCGIGPWLDRTHTVEPQVIETEEAEIYIIRL